jgi:hypothetical protein
MALAEVRRSIQVAENRRATIVRDQRRALEKAGAVSQGRFEAAVVQAYHLYERHLAYLAVQEDARIVELRNIEAERRAELEEAMQRKRVVERLRDKQNEAFQAEVIKEGQQFTDEVATNQAAMARGGVRDR